MQRLALNDLNIREIGHGAFSGMSSLTSLDMSDNPLEDIDVEMFSGLDSLESLYLTDILVQTIRPNTFEKT